MVTSGRPPTLDERLVLAHTRRVKGEGQFREPDLSVLGVDVPTFAQPQRNLEHVADRLAGDLDRHHATASSLDVSGGSKRRASLVAQRISCR
jgi:hypothetical protein